MDSELMAKMTSPVPKTALSDLKALIDQQLELEKMKNEVEDRLKNIKAALKTVSQTDIPDLLSLYGLSRIRLETGEEVTVKSDVSVSVKDWGEFIDFLKERHDDAIVKSVTEIVEPTDEVKSFLDSHDINFTTTKNVHPQTLKAYFREFMSLGEEPPKSVNVYVYSKAKIK